MKKILLIIVIFSCFFVKAQNEKIGDSSVTVHAVLNGKTRAIPKKITLYWDVSLSMQNRNIEGELSLLSNYLKSLNYPEVEVVEFSSGHYKTKVFEASKSKTKNLLKYLKQVDYNGATDYSKILKTNIFNAEVLLLFTNGNAVMSSLESKINISIYCVNSLENARHKKLQEIANFSGGYYINLEKKSIDEALTFMLSEKEDLDVYENDKLESNRKGDVFGTIFSISGQIQGATIRTKDNFLEEESDIDGNYIIDAKLGDVLIVDYLGMLQREVIVSNIKQPLNIELQPEGEVLDEVLVSAKVEKEDKLSYYDKKQKTAGYSSYQIDVKSRHQNLVDVLSGVPGLTVSYNGTYPIFNLMRSYYAAGSSGLTPTPPSNKTPPPSLGGDTPPPPPPSSPTQFDRARPGSPAIIIDNVIYGQDQTFGYPDIDPQEIDNITVLQSTYAGWRYGMEATAGAIVITTKSSSVVRNRQNAEAKLKAFNKALLTKPAYILNLEEATTYKEAYLIYEKQKKAIKNLSVQYYFEVSDYFSQWDPDFSYALLTNIVEVAPTNPKALKALAFKLEVLGKINEAKKIYKQIAIIRPKQAQSYLDLALIYEKSKAYNKAFNLYTKILGNAIEGIDFSGLHEIAENELRRLLVFHKTEIDFSEQSNEFLNTNFKPGIRIVFEWIDFSSEFEIQLVDPQKKHFKWNHDLASQKERMNTEIKEGFGSQEFIIDDAKAGEWQIKIKYLGEESHKNPDFVKYTLYKNYGLPNETKTVKTLKLFKYQDKVTLDAFEYLLSAN